MELEEILMQSDSEEEFLEQVSSEENSDTDDASSESDNVPNEIDGSNPQKERMFR